MDLPQAQEDPVENQVIESDSEAPLSAGPISQESSNTTEKLPPHMKKFVYGAAWRKIVELLDIYEFDWDKSALEKYRPALIDIGDCLESLERDIKDPSEVIRIARETPSDKMEDEEAEGQIQPHWETRIEDICTEARRSPEEWASPLFKGQEVPQWLKNAWSEAEADYKPLN